MDAEAADAIRSRCFSSDGSISPYIEFRSVKSTSLRWVSESKKFPMRSWGVTELAAEAAVEIRSWCFSSDGSISPYIEFRNAKSISVGWVAESKKVSRR